jgi:hypothetical protein
MLALRCVAVDTANANSLVDGNVEEALDLRGVEVHGLRVVREAITKVLSRRP